MSAAAPRRRRWALPTGIAAGAVLLAVPALAQGGMPVELGSQAWQQATSSGFAVPNATGVTAAAGTYSAGSGAGFSWCTPDAESSISAAVVHVTRAQAAASATIAVGPSTSGAGGVSESDGLVPEGATGTNITLSGLDASCVGAAVRQAAAGTSTAARHWTLSLAAVTLTDEQGPSVSDLQIVGPETNGWYTGDIKVFWEAADNALLRGTTGVQISDGATDDLGDAADNVQLSATLDPGADGTHTVTVYRTGGGGWATATASQTIQVDRTPPSVPQMVAPPAGAYPVALATTGSSDPVSGVAAIQFTDDSGASVLGSNVLTRPGTYRIQARAIDGAGLASAWSPAIAVVVPVDGQAGGVLHLARFAVDGRAPGGAGASALVRTWGTHVRVTGTVADALGAGAAGARMTVTQAGVTIARARANARGAFTLLAPVRRSGTLLLHADGGGALADVDLHMRPLLVLTGAAAHATGGRALRVASGGTITISGVARPTPLVDTRPVQLEYLLDGTWLPLGLPGTIGRTGRWQVRYTVARPGSAVVDLRVVLPSQPGLPFATGISPVVRVAIG